MQIDMHYYGTYCLACAAGLDEKTASTIAYAAQFVDDNATKATIEFKDAGSVQMAATAHHFYQFENADKEDQRLVWVPFHFLPGAEGDKFTHRLVCRQANQSKVAEAVLQDALDNAEKPYAEARIGITAHVLADTYSHFGFSGVSSRYNEVKKIRLLNVQGTMREYVEKRLEEFHNRYSRNLIANITSHLAEFFSGALGHGAVGTLPDRPFLKWSFQYEKHDRGKTIVRDNAATFMQGCEHLHSYFCEFAAARKDLASREPLPFSSIRGAVKDIIETQAKHTGRIKAWQDAARSGALLDGAGYAIPKYDERKWNSRIDALDGHKKSSIALREPVYNFFRAARAHRAFLLRDLLPDHGLVVA